MAANETHLLRSPTALPVISSPLQVSPTLMWLSLHTSDGNGTGDSDPHPSTHLSAVMAAHRPDCEKVIIGMASKMADKLCTIGDHQRTQALRLYYIVLENMINAETARLTRLQQQQTLNNPSIPLPPATTNGVAPFRFDSWMFSRAFHASLISVAFELVFFGHHQPATKLFPHVIETLDLSAWDFVRHLELIVRALPTTLPPTQNQPPLAVGGLLQHQSEAHMGVPSPTKRYLKRLENECLAHLVWKRNSPLLRILQEQETKARQQEEQQHAMIVDDGDKSVRQTSDDEKKSVDGVAQPAMTHPSSSNPSPAPSVVSVGMGYLSATHSKQFELFSRQLFTLAAEHLSWLCSPSALNISNLHMEACFELLLEILTCKTHLLYERHLDTIILCVLYNITCKILPPTGAPGGPGSASPSTLVGQATLPPLDFKRIIAVYLSRWEQNQPKVVKEISSFQASANAPANGEEKMNIIAFYNKYFIHEIKVYSLEHIKPKLLAALEAQALIRASGAAPPPPPASTLSSSLTPGRSGLPPTPWRSPLPGGFAPSNPPGSIGRQLPHRMHPYTVTPHSHLAVPAGAITPGYGPHHGAASIHTFLSPRKLHIPSTNIYLSRMSAPPPSSQAIQNVAARVALGATGGPNRPSGSPVRPSSAGPRREEDALATLTSFPLSPVSSSSLSRTNEHSTPGGQSIGSVPLTPMSRSLYAFGESPRKSLDAINMRLNGHPSDLAQPGSSSSLASSSASASYASPQPRVGLAPYPGSGGSTPGSGRNRGSVRQLFTQA